MIPTYTTGQKAVTKKTQLGTTHYVINSQYGMELCYANSLSTAIGLAHEKLAEMQRLYKGLHRNYRRCMPAFMEGSHK